jgi:hypothetical protein
MRPIIFSLILQLVNADYDNEYKEDSYSAIVDPIVSYRVLMASSVKEQRKLGGVFGLCSDGVDIPLHGGLVCDPPNSLPQICTLACKKGYYSSGRHRDIACADAMCEGQCSSTKYDCIGTEMKFAKRPCTVTQYTQCADSDSLLCLEDVTQECSYSFYEEVRRPCCNLTQINPPEGCWTSGCTGGCDSPSVFHYYSNSCADVCPPWRDPDVPQFGCSECIIPKLNENSEIIMSDSIFTNPPSEITVGCSVGFWGAQITSYCMSTDGSFYPSIDSIQCTECSNPPIIAGDVFTGFQLNDSSIEFRCNEGYTGESTFTVCDSISGVWNTPEAPYCDIIVTPSISSSISPSATVGITPELTSSPSPSESPSPSDTPSYTKTMTPSASKSPRPPKVKGSRAPTQPPKLRVK